MEIFFTLLITHSLDLAGGQDMYNLHGGFIKSLGKI